MYELLLFSLFIAVFMGGMSFLRIGLFNLSGKKLKDVLAKVIGSPWKGFIAGIGITGLLQSSSAVMVMTIGFVSARVISFPQSIGVILGSNIGTTFTAEFMTFSVDKYIIPGLIVGAVLCSIPKVVSRSIGTSLIGLCAIFAAMAGFKSLAVPLAGYPFVQGVLGNMDSNTILALLTGIIITAIIHSSSAMVGIAMSFLASGELSISAAIAVMLGANIGTCITGYLASIGSGAEARFTAYAHIWLNIAGVALFYPFIDDLAQVAGMLTGEPDVQLAHASVLFNVITSLAVLPFAGAFARFIMHVHRRKN
ncbi:Na/Pi cotransporter family protein [Peribacillus saganii]|uniref:Na/Pi cotransporter family protein n=1 Tax=Peribacillus saganii TaxID=2303992 RepID=A0A372LV58_9BACI|nr:Na/Pi symporter [Peribacillus saganii]RFU71680.1 Na/Pi cotransporter family protein [Peribacillus saganii]